MSDDQLAGLAVALGQLRDKQQKVLRMKYEQHMKNEEIGRIMNRAAGTIGTYHTKAMGKLRWKDISTWYMDGYEKAARSYFGKTGWEYQEPVRDKAGQISGMDYCLRLGISLKQFRALYMNGIKTIFDLIVASGNENWYKPIYGIGGKSAADILEKLDHIFFQGKGQETE